MVLNIDLSKIIKLLALSIFLTHVYLNLILLHKRVVHFLEMLNIKRPCRLCDSGFVNIAIRVVNTPFLERVL